MHGYFVCIPLLNSHVSIELLDSGDPDLVVAEVVRVKVVLGGDPTQVDAAWVLSREHPHPIKVLVHQLQGLCVQDGGLIGGGSLVALVLPVTMSFHVK